MPQNTVPQDEWSQYAVKDNPPQADEWEQYAVEKKNPSGTTFSKTSSPATSLSGIVGKTVTDGKFTGVLKKDGNDYLIGEVIVDASKVKEVGTKSNVGVSNSNDPFANVVRPDINPSDVKGVQLPPKNINDGRIDIKNLPIEQLPENIKQSVQYAKMGVDATNAVSKGDDEVGNNDKKFFELSLEQYPQNIVAVRGLGDIAAKEGNSNEALKYYSDVLSISNSPDDLVKVATEQNKIANAKQKSQENKFGITQNELDADVMRNHALENINIALQSNPNNADAWETKAAIYQAKGDSKEVTKNLNMAATVRVADKTELLFTDESGEIQFKPIDQILQENHAKLVDKLGGGLAGAVDIPFMMESLKQGITEGGKEYLEGARQQARSFKDVAHGDITTGFKDFWGGFLTGAAGATKMGMAALMAAKPVSGYTFMVGLDLADEISNENASKIAFSALETWLPTKNPLLSKSEFFVDQGIGLALFSIFAHGTREGIEKAQAAVQRLVKGKSLTVDQTKTIVDNINSTFNDAEALQKLQGAIDEVSRDNNIQAAQKRLGIAISPELLLSDDARNVISKIKNGEPVLNQDLDLLSTELHGKYKTYAEAKTAPNRQFTTEQYDATLKQLEEQITALENAKNEQAANEDFVKIDSKVFEPKKSDVNVGELAAQLAAIPKEVSAKIPTDMPVETKVKVAPLIQEKQEAETKIQELQSEKSQLDENFHPQKDEEIKKEESKIESANQEIKEVVASSQKTEVNEEAKNIADSVGGKVVGSMATGKVSRGDTDIRIDGEYDKDATESKLKKLGYEWQGSSSLSPKEMKLSPEKYYGEGWQRIEHFENADGKKIDVWHDDKTEVVASSQKTEANKNEFIIESGIKKTDELKPTTFGDYQGKEKGISGNEIRVPIIIDKEGNVIDGNHRLRYAQENNIQEVPTVTLDFNEMSKQDLEDTINELHDKYSESSTPLVEDKGNVVMNVGEGGKSLEELLSKDGKIKGEGGKELNVKHVEEGQTKKIIITDNDGNVVHFVPLKSDGTMADYVANNLSYLEETNKLETQQPKTNEPQVNTTTENVLPQPKPESPVTRLQGAGAESSTNPSVKGLETQDNEGINKEEKAPKVEKSKLQLAKEKRVISSKEANDYRKSRNKNLGIIKDNPEEIKKQAELDRKLFDDTVDVAREYINETANKALHTAKDFAEYLGEALSDLVQKAWDVVTGDKDYKEAVSEVEAMSEEKVNERRFGLQMLKSDEVASEVKGEVKKNLEYVQRGNQLTVNEAKDLIDKVGVDEAANLVMHSNDVHPATRVVMGEVLIKKFSELASKAKDEDAKNYYLDKAIDTANFVMEKLGTEAGQSIQAFSLFSRLSPEAQLRAASKDQAKIAKNKINKAKKNVDKIGDRFKDANAEAIDEVLSSKETKNEVQKVKETKAAKTKEKLTKIKAKRKKIFDEYKKHGRNLLSANGLSTEGIEFMSKMAATYVEEGVVRFSDLVDKLISHLKDAVGESAVSDELRLKVQYVAQDILGKESERMVTEGLKEMEVNLDKVVRDHYTKSERVKTDLAQKIIANTSLDKMEAQAMATHIQKAFDRIATRKKQAILTAERKRFDRVQEKLKSGKKVEPKALHDEIIRYTNLGAFDNTELAEVIAKKLGTDRLTPEQANEIIRLSNRIQTAPEGAPKREAIEDLLTYRAKLAGTSIGEVGQAVWYSNILSGYQTHEKNFVQNFFTATMDLGLEATEHPALLPYLLSGMAKGLTRRGIPEAINTLTTGRSPIHISKIEVPTVLERTNFSGGKFNPYNYLKYVMRAMVASDVMSFQSLKEARATQLAFRQARAEGFNPYSRKAWHRVNEILLNTKDRYDEATEQVKQEGLFGQKAKRRIWELMEQNRPQQMVDDSYGFAAEGTFNHPTQGTLGAVTDAFAKTLDITVKGARPLRFLVPFTRIVTNVVNRGLDYSLIGGIRAARGVRGFEGSEKYKVMTPEERTKMTKRFAIGTTLTAGLGILAQMGYLQITGAGTGNYKKDEQLKQSGWQPFSLKIGDKYYSYQYTPLMINLSLLGNYFDNEKYGLYSDETALRKMELAAWQTMSLAANMTWVGGTAGLLSAFSEKTPEPTEKKIDRAIGGVVKGLAIPNIYTQIAKQVEEINGAAQKETNNLYDKMIQDVPVARNKLNDRLNALGEPIPVDASIFISNTKHNKYWDFLNSHGIWIGVPNQKTVLTFDEDTKQDRPITDTEYYNLIKYRGDEIKNAIDEIQDNGIWIDSNDPKRAFIKKPDEAGEFENISLDEATKTQLQRAISTISRQATMGAKKEVFNPE